MVFFLKLFSCTVTLTHMMVHYGLVILLAIFSRISMDLFSRNPLFFLAGLMALVDVQSNVLCDPNLAENTGQCLLQEFSIQLLRQVTHCFRCAAMNRKIGDRQWKISTRLRKPVWFFYCSFSGLRLMA